MREEQGFESPLIGAPDAAQAAGKMQFQETPGCAVEINPFAQHFVISIAIESVERDGYHATFAVGARILHLESGMLGGDGILLDACRLGMHKAPDELIGRPFVGKLSAV